MSGLEGLTAIQAARWMAEGRITSEDLVKACLDRIAAHEPVIKAWAHLDGDLALAQARDRDSERRQGRAVGPLHGIPVGIKDIIDTNDYPCERGTPLYEGRRPFDDAFLVTRLREAGAVILGKTVTTEMAYFSPGATTNPHDPGRTPGGSSSGSAAAVAAFMTPLSVGTQTNGSMIRPASFCGIYGYKPSHGRISRTGVLQQSPDLESPGVFARTLDDLAVIGDVLIAHDPADSVMRLKSHPCLAATLAEEVPMPPSFAFVRTPVWNQADESTKDGCRELCEALGDRVQIVDLPPAFDTMIDHFRTVMEVDVAVNFEKDYGADGGRLSPVLGDLIRHGRATAATDYLKAKQRARDYLEALTDLFADFDAILTPSAPGEAPTGLEATGSPAFCSLWSLTGLPCLNLPLLSGPNGLPVGVQLVGALDDDGRLFRTARWLSAFLEDA
ncbi:MAG: amidase [Rhodospirillales bacterium]